MNNKLVALSILLFVVTGILLIFSRGRSGPGGPERREVRDSSFRDVVLARQVIPPRTIITPDMVRLDSIDLRDRSVAPDALLRVDQAIDQVSAAQIVPNQPLVPAQLTPREAVGVSGQIPAGFRAMTILVNDTTGVAGLIRPGDRVDVLATLDRSEAELPPMTETLIHNALVVAVGKTLEKKPLSAAEPPTLLTLALRPSEAEYLSAAQVRATIFTVARPLMDEQAGTLIAEAPPVRAPVIIQEVRALARRKRDAQRAPAPGPSRVAQGPTSAPSGRARTAPLPPVPPDLVYPIPVPEQPRERPAPPVVVGPATDRPAPPPTYTVSVIRGTQREQVTLPITPESRPNSDEPTKDHP
ncbi:MAG: Flp pilus assembly protein CpaB [Armatimonadetes bacterium]|nr:Flp pilus assembly protein CpaB [Armatimonadota bacterium]